MAIDKETREIFHFCFLEQLLKISDPKLYVLKGGVNLRFFFNSPRYSEDMDIDVMAGHVETLKKNGYKILNDEGFIRRLKTFRIKTLVISDPSKAKHTGTTQRFKLHIVMDSGETLPTKIEFSRRKRNALHHYAVERIDLEIARRYHRLSFFCQHYTGDAAVLQKVEALAGRTETEARDVFDIALLLSMGYGKTILPASLSSRTLQAAKERALSVTHEDFKGQVLEFLEETDRRQYASEKIWSLLQKQILDLTLNP